MVAGRATFKVTGFFHITPSPDPFPRVRPPVDSNHWTQRPKRDADPLDQIATIQLSCKKYKQYTLGVHNGVNLRTYMLMHKSINTYIQLQVQCIHTILTYNK